MSLCVVDGDPWAVSVSVIVEDGNIRFSNSTYIEHTGKVYGLSFASIIHYNANIGEGYAMTDIRNWEDKAAGVLSLTKSYNGGTPGYTCHLPFTGTEQVTMASIDKFYNSTDSQVMIDAKKVRVGDIASTAISAEGASAFLILKLRGVNGKLQSAGITPLDWEKETKSDWSHAKEMDLGGGNSYLVG